MSDEAVVACIARAGALIEPRDEREVVIAAIATGRASAVAPSLRLARDAHEDKTRSAIVESLLALRALDEASQLEVASLIGTLDMSAQRWDELYVTLARRADATARVKAAIVVAAPANTASQVLEGMKLEDDSAVALVEAAFKNRRLGLVADVLKKHPSPRVRDKVREAIDDLDDGPERETLWRALVETTGGR